MYLGSSVLMCLLGMLLGGQLSTQSVRLQLQHLILLVKLIM
jgi:hypothetical protein